MYHPLLKNPVSNSIRYAQNVVISGDNASGKTTFMRSVAVNCVLSESLNFALAREFSLRSGGILSSMNISDDLTSGESHFVAEGKRIKTIIEALSDDSFNLTEFGAPEARRLDDLRTCLKAEPQIPKSLRFKTGAPHILFNYLFLDEIFNGTNSAERVSIDASLMEWLADKNCLYIISTHDFELIKAVKRFNQNYHFTTDSSGESDYRLKQGISRTTNAIATLKKLDFPEIIPHSSVEKLNKILDNGNLKT
jgi:DNA mismatch repair ATPase MutS